MPEFPRPWAPTALAAGGLAWTAWSLAVVVAGGVDRLISAVVALSGLLLAVGLAGLAFTLAWSYRSPGGEGAGLAALGASLFAAGQAVTAVQGADGLATWLVAPGVLALVAGSVLLGAGLVRARRTPPWLGVALVAGSVCFLGFNATPSLALPFGLAWTALGAYLRRRPDPPTDHLEPGVGQ